MWLFLSVLWALVVACGPLVPAQAQDQYFSGSVTAISSSRITVSRTALGETSTRTFAITPETRIDGRPSVNAKVTVQFGSVDGVERATHIIVRPPDARKKR